MTQKVDIKHTFTYEGIKVNIYHANKHEGLPRHEHIYSHATMCHAGSCLISLEGRTHIINKDSTPLNLLANQWHEIEALEDGTVFVNVFAEDKS